MENVKVKKESNKEVKENKKLSYEELSKYASQLVDVNNKLKNALQEALNDSFMKRIDILFMVLKYKELFGNDFTTMCVEELKEIITINRDEEPKEDK